MVMGVRVRGRVRVMENMILTRTEWCGPTRLAVQDCGCVCMRQNGTKEKHKGKKEKARSHSEMVPLVCVVWRGWG